MPSVDIPAVAADAGLARVIISTDTPARVLRKETLVYRGRHTHEALLCEATPCVVTLPYGDYELEFIGIGDADRKGAATVHARTETVIVNHALGMLHVPPGQRAGLAVMLLGTVLLCVAGGVAKGMAQEGREVSSDTRSALGALAAVSLGGIVIGGLAMAANPTTMQPGATTEWTPAPGTLGGSATWKF